MALSFFINIYQCSFMIKVQTTKLLETTKKVIMVRYAFSFLFNLFLLNKFIFSYFKNRVMPLPLTQKRKSTPPSATNLNLSKQLSLARIINTIKHHHASPIVVLYHSHLGWYHFFF